MPCYITRNKEGKLISAVCTSPKKKRACEQCSEWDEVDNFCYNFDCKFRYGKSDIRKGYYLCQHCKSGVRKDKIVKFKDKVKVYITAIVTEDIEIEMQLCPECYRKYMKEKEEENTDGN